VFQFLSDFGHSDSTSLFYPFLAEKRPCQTFPLYLFFLIAFFFNSSVPPPTQPPPGKAFFAVMFSMLLALCPQALTTLRSGFLLLVPFSQVDMKSSVVSSFFSLPLVALRSADSVSTRAIGAPSSSPVHETPDLSPPCDL